MRAVLLRAVPAIPDCAIERIATGYGWQRVAEPLIIRGSLDDAALQRGRELGQTLAGGLAYGIF